jgi:2-phospho-L-lactate guanylyltransferase
LSGAGRRALAPPARYIRGPRPEGRGALRTLAVLPIKSFDAAKRRLSESLGGGSRHLLAQSMFSDVFASLRRASEVAAIAVVTHDHEAEAIVRGDGVALLRDEPGGGQSAAAAIGVGHARASGFDRILLIPGDTPLVTPDEIDALLARARAERLSVAIVPDRHGEGTNALVLAPPAAIAPSFGPGSLERHLDAARSTELAHGVLELPSLMHDVDTVDDLRDLAGVLEGSRGVAQRTRGALRQFDRLRADSAAPRATAAERVAVTA